MRRRSLMLAAGAALLLAAWLPRGLELDRFAVADEPAWLAVSANFYRAVRQADWGRTMQLEHPGVTVMWAGAAAFHWRYPEYATEAPGEWRDIGEIEGFLRARSRSPLELLVAGRAVLVLANVALLGVALWMAVRLVGAPGAGLTFLLLAFDPLHVGLSRLLQPDGLLASAMFLSLVALLVYLERGGHFPDLLVAGAAAGLAGLTKLPGLALLPVGATLLLLCAPGPARSRPRQLLVRLGAPAVFCATAMTVFAGLWPALWNVPDRMWALMGELLFHQQRGHFVPVYFMGHVLTGDPGSAFYGVVFLWRTTPVVLLGLVLASALALGGSGSPARRAERRIALVLGGFAIGFALLLTLVAKKFDRYLVPVHPVLALLAALGLLAAARRLAASPFGAVAGAALIGSAIAVQTGLALHTHPYYLSYYNPLLGGGARAPRVLMVGWGEGLDEAARYLNAQRAPSPLHVLSWYSLGPFSYFFFRGEVLHLDGGWSPSAARDLERAHYAVLYVNQWQRRMIPGPLAARLAEGSLERTITLNGAPYVRIYRLTPPVTRGVPLGRSPPAMAPPGAGLAGNPGVQQGAAALDRSAPRGATGLAR